MAAFFLSLISHSLIVFCRDRTLNDVIFHNLTYVLILVPIGASLSLRMQHAYQRD